MTPLPEPETRACATWQGSGNQAASLAPLVWSALGARGQRAILWDVDPEHRTALFVQALRRAELVHLAWDRQTNALYSVVWIVPLMADSRCGVLHFCCTRHAPARALAEDFLCQPELVQRFDSLMGFVPVPYRHARRFAADVGFEELGIFPGACWMAAQGKVVPGAVLRLLLHRQPMAPETGGTD